MLRRANPRAAGDARHRPDFWIPSEREYVTYVPPDVPAMTTAWELCLFEAYARDAYRANGQIVDLGCWLGATAHALARGLDRNKHVVDPPPAEIFDRFVWTEEMNDISEDIGLGHRYSPGDSYYDDAQANIGIYGDRVRVHRKDLLEYVPADEPIEFLLVDAQKSWDLGHSITTGFFPLLIEGSSYVVQQDFCYHRLDEVATRMITWFLRDHLEVVHHVPLSSSVVFRCTKRIKRGKLPAFTADLLSPEEIDAAYEWCYGCVAEEGRSYIRVGKICHLLDIGLVAEAASEAEGLNEDGMPIHETSRSYALACVDAALGEDESLPHGAIRRALAEAPSAGD